MTRRGIPALVGALLTLALVPIRGYSVESQSKSGPSSNAALAKVLVTAEGRLVAECLPGAKSYAIHVPCGKESIAVTAGAQDANARVYINGIPVANGQPSGLIPLEHGLNGIDVMIEAEDRKTQAHYEVKVIRPYPTPNWVKVLDNAPWTARDSAGEMVCEDRMWLFGGYVPELISDVWTSKDGKSWERHNDFPDENGINIPLTYVYKGKMWMSSSKGFFSSDDGEKWDLVSAKLPAGGGCGAVFKEKMWVVGGKAGKQVWSSTDGVEWKLEQAEAPWSQRSHIGNVVVHDGKLWVVGGCLGRYQPFKGYRDVWCSKDGVNWDLVTGEAPWPGRRWSSCVVYRNRIWMLGGFRGQPTWQNFNDVWYSADGKEWRQLVTEDIWSPRHEISTYVYNERLWVVAGNAWPLVNDVWQLHVPGMTFVSQPVFEEYAGAGYYYRAEADFNESAKPIHYRLAKSPDWLSIDSKTGAITGTPPETGDFPVVVEAYDEAGETARQEYAIHVVPL